MNEGDGPGGELVFDPAVLLIRQEGAVLGCEFALQIVEGSFDRVGGLGWVSVVYGGFEEAPVDEACFECAGGRGGEGAGGVFDAEDSEVRLFAWEGNSDIERVAVCPVDEFFGGVAPFESEWRIENSLGRKQARECQPRDDREFHHWRRMGPVVEIDKHGSQGNGWEGGMKGW